MEPREVCKICYNSTSHKPTPTLTYEPKSSDSENSGVKTCGVCHQEWAPIRVAKELGSSRWVRIRPRPKLQNYIDFMMCKNMKSKYECPKGQDCSYAHSQAELWAWNQERQKEPRPAPQINGSYQYQLCKYISKSGNCPYGMKCTFAHNEEELQSWLKVQGVAGAGSHTSTQTRSSSSYGGSFRCNVCQLKCNSKKQLEEHINSSRHRQYFPATGGNGGGYSRQQHPPPRLSNTSHGNSSSHTRPRPTLSFHITGFRLCVHVQNGRRCLYGDYCTFAHSEAELEAWNQQGQRSKAHSVKALDSGSGPTPDRVTPTRLPVEKPLLASSDAKEEMEFASAVRARVAKEHKDTDTVLGLEACRDGVTVREVTDTDLAVSTSNSSPISWVFEVATTVPQTLQSVLLFDPLNSDFAITYILKYNSGSWDKVPVQAQAEQGVGMLLSCKMRSSDKLQVKVTVKPRCGLVGQLLVFQFGSFHMVQCMVVRMITESEKLLKPKFSSGKRPSNIDLFWENHYNKIAMENTFMEETDRGLPEYLLPQQIETLIEKGKYSNVENRVTKENYKRRMHNLLYLEEYQQRLDLSRYDLYDVEVEVKSEYTTSMGVNYAVAGFHYITLPIDELLYEGGQSISHGDSVLLLPGNQQVVHECSVEHVGRDEVVLKITEKAKLASASSRYRVSIRFVLGRITMQAMHYAVDQLDLDSLFPEGQATPNTSIPSSPDVQKCLDVLKDSVLNPFQLQAIASMLDPSCLKIPSLVLGPFGCGKTRTLSECIELLALHMPESRVLVCTHSNSAADLYVENLDSKWKKLSTTPPSLFRLYYTGRRLNTLSSLVKRYCRIQGDRLGIPDLAEMKSYKIVVTTLSTARTLALMDIPKGHFTHILIDEAAQALESETLIPLSLASSQTKIVLAGDHMQLDPPVYSDIARKYGLHVSLLERLYDLEAYESGVGQLCKTLLTENHRSHQLILDLPSQLFYKNKLTCKAKFADSGPEDLPPVKFVCVEGQEEQDEDSPSYYNRQEVVKVVEEAKLLVDGGLRAEDVCVLAYYSKQVQQIRNFMRQNMLSKVQVHRVDNVQGKEFRALIISTVRTSASESSSEREGGFLTNPKLFNTAVTRARQWLIVVGEPVSLCTVGSNRSCWLEYIRRCIGLKSFQHPHPSEFVGSLDYKIVTRRLLESTHQEFFKSAVVEKRPVAKTVSSPTAEQPTSEPSRLKTFGVASQQQRLHPDGAREQREDSSGIAVGVAHSPTVQEHAAGDQPIRSFASKLQDSQPSLKGSSRVTNRFSPKASLSAAISLTNHTSLHTAGSNQPSQPSVHSSSQDGGMLVNHSSAGQEIFPHSDMLPLDDLPKPLRNMIDSLSSYSTLCEQMLAASYPLRISSQINDNLQRQRSLVDSQMKSVQEQVQLYREYMKLHNSPNSAGQSDVSSTQQFHFPTALPPSNPNSLNSAFTYDVGNSYFASGPPSLGQGSKSQLR